MAVHDGRNTHLCVVSCNAHRTTPAIGQGRATPSRASPALAERPDSPGDQQVNLVAFIGRRLDIREIVEPIPDGSIRFNSKHRARYQVLQVIFGTYPAPEIEFSAYEHMGLGFDRFETVLLYVSREGDDLIQQKYQFQPVFMTERGTWAGCGDPYAGEPAPDKRTVHAIPLIFAPEVTFETAGLTESQIHARFPSPYFQISHGVAICRMGATPEDLLRVKREGVLKWRGVFRTN